MVAGGEGPDYRRCLGRTKGGLNSKLHAVCDGRGRPLVLLLTEDIEQITRRFGISKGQLAEMAGLGSDTLQKVARRNAQKTRARIIEMFEIISRVEAWAGGQAQAMAWYRVQPLAALDGPTAEALVKSGGAGAVRDYLDYIALGGFT